MVPEGLLEMPFADSRKSLFHERERQGRGVGGGKSEKSFGRGTNLCAKKLEEEIGGV